MNIKKRYQLMKQLVKEEKRIAKNISVYSLLIPTALCFYMISISLNYFFQMVDAMSFILVTITTLIVILFYSSVIYRNNKYRDNIQKHIITVLRNK